MKAVDCSSALHESAASRIARFGLELAQNDLQKTELNLSWTELIKSDEYLLSLAVVGSGLSRSSGSARFELMDPRLAWLVKSVMSAGQPLASANEPMTSATRRSTRGPITDRSDLGHNGSSLW